MKTKDLLASPINKKIIQDGITLNADKLIEWISEYCSMWTTSKVKSLKKWRIDLALKEEYILSFAITLERRFQTLLVLEMQSKRDFEVNLNFDDNRIRLRLIKQYIEPKVIEELSNWGQSPGKTDFIKKYGHFYKSINQLIQPEQ